MLKFLFDNNNLWILQSLRSFRMTSKSHSEQSEESIINSYFYLLIYWINFYHFLLCKGLNLDVIIAVGCRVNSKKATQFRIWATQVLKK